MLEQTTAIYFDGESSTPHYIELFFNKTNQTLYFEKQNKEIVKWRINDLVFQTKSDVLTIQLNDKEAQNILVENKDFTAKINAFLKEKGKLSWYQNILNIGFKAHIIIAFLLLSLIVVSYVFFIPFIGEKAVNFIPESYDTKLGNIAFKQSMLINEIDSVKTKKLNKFVSHLNLKSSKKLNFTVVDSDIVNAYALPDGNVVVFTGILKEMKSYEELVGLIGHEVAHVTHRHSMKLLCRDLSGYLFVSAIIGDVNGVMAVVADNANSLRSLSFSRDYEKEADVDGFNVLIDNNLNPKGMSDLFKRLQKEEKEFSIPEFLSSHPITKDRIDYIEKMIKKESISIKENLELKSIFEELKNK
jgi:beta-barrel assembly-enhancing protease